MEVPGWFEIAFWSVAVVVSLFLGFFCFAIHGLDRKSYKLPAKIQQVWLNFVGALVGWMALWFLVRQWWGAWSLPSLYPEVPVHWTWADFGLALVAFVGISGYLPYAVIGAIQSSVALIRSLLQSALKWLFPAAE